MKHTLPALMLLACGGGGATVDAGASGGGDDGGGNILDARRRPDAGPVAPHDRLFGLADNTAVDLGPITCLDPDGDEGSCRRATDYGGFLYDRGNHQLLMFGGGHATTMTDTVHTFDLSAGAPLTWSQRYQPTPCASMVGSNLDRQLGAWLTGPSGPYPRPLSAHTYDLVGYAPDLDQLVLVGRLFTGGYCNQVGNDEGGPAAHYDLGTDTWSFATDRATIALNDEIPASEYDPVSKRFVVYGAAGLATYDPATRTATPHVTALAAAGYSNHLVYFPPNDRFYYFERATGYVTELALDRANLAASVADRFLPTGPIPAHYEPGYDVDLANEIIGGAIENGVFYAFDPRTRRWSSSAILGDAPATQAFRALAYDPVNNVFIVRDDTNTYAYRYRSLAP